MKDNLNFSGNGRQPNFTGNERRPQFFRKLRMICISGYGIVPQFSGYGRGTQ